MKIVPKREDENTKKPKSRCDTNHLSIIGENSNDTSQAIIHYDDVFTIRCVEDDRWLVSCDTFSCGSSSYLAVSANTYNGPIMFSPETLNIGSLFRLMVNRTSKIW